MSVRQRNRLTCFMTALTNRLWEKPEPYWCHLHVCPLAVDLDLLSSDLPGKNVFILRLKVSFFYISVYVYTSSHASGCKIRFKAFLSSLCSLQVFLTECVGPLIIYLMFYFRLPFIYSPKYDFTSSKNWVVQWVSTCLGFQGSVEMSQHCNTQSQALHRRPLNTCEAYCYGDTDLGPSVKDCSKAMY